MSEHISLVATFGDRSLAETTIEKLQEAGFDMSKLSVVEKHRQATVGDLKGASTVSGLNALDVAQYSCIPKESIPDYEAELEIDKLLLVAHGTADEIAEARRIIDSAHPEGWDGNVGCAVYYGCLD